jgi:hypothetical protein
VGRRAALGVRPFWRGRHRSEYRRTIRYLLNRGETRNSLARDVFHSYVQLTNDSRTRLAVVGRFVPPRQYQPTG